MALDLHETRAFMPLAMGWTVNWADGPGWDEDGPLALKSTRRPSRRQRTGELASGPGVPETFRHTFCRRIALDPVEALNQARYEI